MAKRINWSLIGIPDHEAVLPVGGRIGAAHGPRAFIRAFNRLRGREDLLSGFVNAGEVSGMSSDVALNHQRAAAAICATLLRTGGRMGWIGHSVVVGGSHDHGYSQLVGVRNAFLTRPEFSRGVRLGCINIDAHLDVRKPNPQITSGSPFYLALENGTIAPQDLVQFGIQSHCNGPELWSYVEAKKVQVVPFEKLRGGKAVVAFEKALAALAVNVDAIVISLDLDAISSAFAPGVSAPQAEGFDSSEVIAMMEIAGAQAKVTSLGIFELNPDHDEGDKTARLAATAAYHFVASASLA